MQYSMLVNGANVISKLPIAIAIVFALILVAAFVIGYKIGFRKIHWGGVFCLIACGLFVGMHKLLAATPAKAYFLNRFEDRAVNLVLALTTAAASVLIAMILYGLCTVLFRPREGKKGVLKNIQSSNPFKLFGEDDGLFNVYLGTVNEQQEDNLFTPYGTEPPKKKPRPKKKLDTLVRIGGGVTCMVNVAMILAAVLSVFVFLIHGTELRAWQIGRIFDSTFAQHVRNFLLSYALDFATISCVVGIACLGWKFGFMNSLRVFIITVGIVATTVVCVGFPFTRFATQWTIPNVLFVRCRNLTTVFTVNYNGITARLLMSFLLSQAGIGLMILLFLGVNKLYHVVKDYKLAALADKCAACFVYLLTGIVICAAVWGFMYALDYYDFFNVHELCTSRSNLAKGLFSGCNRFVNPVLERIIDRFN